MGIPFHDDDPDDLGSAAFVLLDGGTEAGTGTVRGALLRVDARGEPLDFTHNRLPTPGGFLWRARDLPRWAARRLVASLCAACPGVPRVLLCRADQVPAGLFGGDVWVAVPVVRVAVAGGGRPPPEADPGADLEETEPVELPGPPGRRGTATLAWSPAAPAPGSPERRLVDLLVRRDLLLEPFERAGLGLRAVYDEPMDGPA